LAALVVLEVSRKYATPRVTTSIVHIEDHKAFIEKARREAITRRKMILVLQNIDPLDFSADWCSDLEAPDWTPLTPEQIQEQRELARKRDERDEMPGKPVHVPSNPSEWPA
jgi:hypothetical protein